MEFFHTNNIHLYIAIFLSILNGAILAFISGKFLQVIQQAGYQMKSYYSWLRGTKYKYLSRLFTLGLLSFFCATVTNALLDVYHNNTLFSYIGLIFYAYFCGVFIFNLVKEPNKMPLVRTKRIGRNFGLLFVLYSLATFFLVALSTNYLFLIRFGIITLTPILVPFFVIIAFYIVLPFEKIINNYYILKANKKLLSLPNLIRIGITGSYGKTTNKFILDTMLKQKYKTISSPHSYNTPLGLTRVILQQIKPDDQIFIAEMGAKKVGEIKELCEIIKPNHGILTSVGTQHLESFKTQENIKQTKFELAKYIENGYMIFNGDSKICLELFNEYKNENKIITYQEDPNGFCYCDEIKADEKGLQFVLHIGTEQTKCVSQLLGKHNLQNISMCSALAYKLGVSLKQIKHAISLLTPTEHRLEIVKTENKNMIVIDDSYNASVEGCKAALEVLNMYKDYHKIIVTPGIVEMGKLETTANFDFGKDISQVCDTVIIVNELNHKSIEEGLSCNNFNKENIIFVENLTEAKEKLTIFANKKTVVLFENDLPDLFIY